MEKKATVLKRSASRGDLARTATSIDPAILWDIERRKREIEKDDRVPLYVPLPERGPPEVPRKETEFVIEF
jgi:hypothetical protein